MEGVQDRRSAAGRQLAEQREKDRGRGGRLARKALQHGQRPLTRLPARLALEHRLEVRDHDRSVRDQAIDGIRRRTQLSD
ncbi:MAG TPA: hypothetical protein VK081_08570, partial [Planctomycetota bacterium]|nr:hypothetical protein [Planctomycetota bacterium]